jgi:hypothetical protein
MLKKIIIFSGLFMASIFLFQNCSESVGFDSASKATTIVASEVPEDTHVLATDINTVCNPLDPSEPCSQLNSGQGLIGDLYYLTPEIHGAQFNNNLNTAILEDYRNFGIHVPVKLIMSSINITPRSWDAGFNVSNGEQVQTEAGLKLFEWFHLDMSGFISLPAGTYQFATVSDDGMRVSLNSQVIINADRVHAPRYDCSIEMVNFTEGEKKYIRVEYFQGPRNRIAMQLLIRMATKNGLECGSGGEFEPIGAEYYFRN